MRLTPDGWKIVAFLAIMALSLVFWGWYLDPCDPKDPIRRSFYCGTPR